MVVCVFVIAANECSTWWISGLMCVEGESEISSHDMYPGCPPPPATRDLRGVIDAMNV